MGSYIATASPWEANLMARIEAQEEGAFGELFECFRNKIYRTAFRILNEKGSAEDALQETFLNIYRAAGRFRGDSKVGTWINRITVNVCLEIIRKNKKHDQRLERYISEPLDLPDSTLDSAFEKVHQAELKEKVQGAMSRLVQKHRVVVKLHDLEGFTIREISTILQIAEGTVKSRLFYGREALKKKLGTNH